VCPKLKVAPWVQQYARHLLKPPVMVCFLGALGGIFINAELVGLVEEDVQVGKIMFGFWDCDAPFVEAFAEEAGVLEVCENDLDCSEFGDRIVSNCCNLAPFCYVIE
jgi:hypothetical protein